MFIGICLVEVDFVWKFELFILDDSPTDAFVLVGEELEYHVIFTFKFT